MQNKADMQTFNCSCKMTSKMMLCWFSFFIALNAFAINHEEGPIETAPYEIQQLIRQSTVYLFSIGKTADGKKIGQACTGVITKKRIISTAKHCCEDFGDKPIFVVFPKQMNGRVSSKDPSYMIFATERMVIDSSNDLCRIRVPELPENFKAVSTLPLDFQYNKHQKVIVAGFGKQTSLEKFDFYRPQLRYGYSEFEHENAKNSSYSDLVAFKKENSAGVCIGDSGGPVFSTNAQGHFVLVSILSGGLCEDGSLFWGTDLRKILNNHSGRN